MFVFTINRYTGYVLNYNVNLRLSKIILFFNALSVNIHLLQTYVHIHTLLNLSY